ncbi:hypothetical protein ACHHYP_08145 [Achlya hypogyna]|uniref:Uncharacterized protein n=1 Tax=Achlya hypogyna TaxID=1202772 RepID=A0A1V9ZL99_ACHHY|nr:hypothetical protein ACHHYP_08145 [Achlya hypogyna]
MAEVLDEYAVALQVIFLDAIGVATVRVNPRTQKRHYAQQAGLELSFAGYLQVMHKYRICPDLLSRQQVARIYSPHGHERDRRLDYVAFVTALAKTALFIFSGPEWDGQYPDDDHKVRLLLLWMDETSQIFKKNGSRLCQAKRTAASDPESFTEQVDYVGRVRQLDLELKHLFLRYCPSGTTAMNNLSFIRCIKDLGLCEEHNPHALSTVDLDILFQQIRPSQPRASHAIEYGQPPCGSVIAVRFLSFTLEYILPALVQFDADLTQDSVAWRQRWRELCALREELVAAQTAKPSMRVTPKPPADEVNAISELHALQVHLESELQQLRPCSPPGSPCPRDTLTESFHDALNRLSENIRARIHVDEPSS